MGIFKNFFTKKHFIPYGTDPAKDAMVDSAFDEIRLEMAIEGYGLNILVKDRLYPIREAVARQGYKLNILVKDESEWVRKAVAEQGYKLNVLIKDESSEVRAAVAEQGYGLDILVNDEFWLVREAVAKQGYGLDVLINDKNVNVRIAVAEQGYGLDILVNDRHWFVREAVARQGYGLDVLINDKDDDVRKAVLNYLKENNLTLAEWCERNNKEIDLKKLAYSPYPEARVAAIKSGYVYKESKMYIAPDCKFIPYGTDPEKDKMVKGSDYEKRLKMAEEGYGLDILINDEDRGIREAVAYQGYGLDVLINDENSYVQGAVRNYLTSHNLTLEQWKSNQEHKRAEPRRKVAEHGIALDVLINDEDYDVRKTVLDYLKTRFMTLSQWANYEEKSLDFNKLLNSPYEEVRLEAFRCVYKDNIDNLKSVGFPIDFKDIEDVKDHIFDDPTTCIKALRFLGDESVKSDEKYKEVLSILVSKAEELKRDYTSFPEKFNSFIKNGPYSVFKDFEKVRNGSLDINDPSISRSNTMKLEIQNLRNQISILTKDNKSLQETLEKYVSVKKETDEKEL